MDIKEPLLVKIEFENPEEIEEKEEMQCEICLDMFINEETLEKHYKCHENLPMLESKGLQTEENSERSCEKEMYNCHHHSSCTDPFTQDELVEHCKHHNIKIENSTQHFKKALRKYVRPREKIEESCEICFELFSTRQDLNLHYDIHENVYTCVDCDAGFKRIIEYVTHTKSHRADNLYQCPSCDVQTDERHRMSSHLQSHECYRRYKCKICEKRFRSFHPYDEHVKIFHKGAPPLPCQICGETFKSSQKLTAHRIKKHTFKECDLCHKNFASYEIMRRHRMSAHSSANYLKCDVCAKVFKKRIPFEIHVRSHQGEKPFECSYCDKKFLLSSNKRHHERIHTGEKPYKCPVCNRAFARRNCMNRHSRTHTGERPYKCSFCEKTFSNNSYKKDHERTHTGDKPYKCRHCNKAFAQRSTMVKHSRLHSGERPYVCGICGRDYCNKDSLQSHFKNCKDLG